VDERQPTGQQLWLLRHADAGDPAQWAGSDDERPLSAKGERQAERLGQFLAAIRLRPDAIVSSPKLRARRTAEIVGSTLGIVVSIDERLGGGVDLRSADGVIATAGDPPRPMLVGHDPDFSELLGTLVGAAQIPMRKGALARLDVVRPLRAGGGTLRWLVPPDLLRRG
jgi:phosphohistidine phosphatase